VRLTSRVSVLLAALAALAGCRERAAALLQFDASMSPPPSPRAEEPHQVHFTLTAADAVTFSWSGSAGTLRYWTRDIPPRTIAARPPSQPPVSSVGPWWEAVADGLIPGQEYQYEVGSPYRPTTQMFRAPVPRGAGGFSFIAVGDLGADGDTTTAAAVNRLIRRADQAFVLGLGGLGMSDDEGATAADRHFEDMMVWSRRTPYMPVWGARAWPPRARDDLRNYEGRFALPHAAAAAGAPAGSSGEDWYWFDQGRARVIVYPEPYAPGTWRAWAEAAEPLFAAAEADPSVRFVVTAGYRAAYSSTEGGGSAELRAVLDGFGGRFSKYVLNLAGRPRAYERTTPQAHVVHVNVGIGGGALARAATPCGWLDCKLPGAMAFRALHHGLLRVTVRDADLLLEAFCAGAASDELDARCGAGQLLDSAVIGRGGAGAAAASGGPRKRAALARTPPTP
jgi:hypothetical protein